MSRAPRIQYWSFLTEAQARGVTELLEQLDRAALTDEGERHAECGATLSIRKGWHW